MAPTMKYLNKLSGKRVLVLGGTSGIGFCVAEAALEHGAHVTVSSSNPDRVANVVERLKKAYPESSTGGVGGGGAVAGHVCDLSQIDRLEENLDGLLKVAAATGGEEGGSDGKISHVVITAGDVPHLPRLSEMTVEAIRDGGSTRFYTPLILAKLLHKYMDFDPANSFTFTGGVIARKPMPGATLGTVYASALEGVMRGLALDLKPLRVNIVEPGSVGTELVDKMAASQFTNFVNSPAGQGQSSAGKAGIGNPEDMAKIFRAKMDEAAKSSTLTGTVASPEDVAETYIGVMKDTFVAGAVVETSGGRLLV